MKTTMKHKNEKTAIIQQSFNNEKPMKHTNKHENVTQQWKKTLKHSNEKQQSYYNEKQWITRMTKQQLFNNHTTIVQQRKTMKYENETQKSNTKWRTTLKHSNDK